MTLRKTLITQVLRKIDFEREMNDAEEDQLPDTLKSYFKKYSQGRGAGRFGSWLIRQGGEPAALFKETYRLTAKERGMSTTPDGTGTGRHK